MSALTELQIVVKGCPGGDSRYIDRDKLKDAKAAAAKQNHADDWDYIHSIYVKMGGRIAKETAKSSAVDGHAHVYGDHEVPRDLTSMSAKQHDNAIKHLSSYTLEELHEKDNALRDAHLKAHEDGDEKALHNIYVMQRHVHEATHKREPETGEKKETVKSALREMLKAFETGSETDSLKRSGGAALQKQKLDRKPVDYVPRFDGPDPEPTEAQKLAGNYKKGHFKIHGMDVSIENEKGSYRSGKDSNGKEWRTRMNADYGYIRRTEGADGDHVDVFVGPDKESDSVFVVDQVNPETGRFDEHKCMLCYKDEQAAREGYLANYEKGWKGLGKMTAMSVEEFKEWLKNGDTGSAMKSFLGFLEEFIKARPATIGEVHQWATGPHAKDKSKKWVAVREHLARRLDKHNAPAGAIQRRGSMRTQLRIRRIEIEKELEKPDMTPDQISQMRIDPGAALSDPRMHSSLKEAPALVPGAREMLKKHLAETGSMLEKIESDFERAENRKQQTLDAVRDYFAAEHASEVMKKQEKKRGKLESEKAELETRLKALEPGGAERVKMEKDARDNLDPDDYTEEDDYESDVENEVEIGVEDAVYEIEERLEEIGDSIRELDEELEERKDEHGEMIEKRARKMDYASEARAERKLEQDPERELVAEKHGYGMPDLRDIYRPLSEQKKESVRKLREIQKKIERLKRLRKNA